MLSPLKISSVHQRAMYLLKIKMLVSPEKKTTFGKISANVDNEEIKQISLTWDFVDLWSLLTVDLALGSEITLHHPGFALFIEEPV